jgi:chromosome segregation ATPase
MNSLASEARRAQVAIDGISGELDLFEGADGRLQSLREQLDEARKDEDHHGGQYGDLSVRKGNANEEAESLLSSLKTAKAEMRDFDARVGKAGEKARRLKDARHVVLVEKNSLHADLDICKEDKQRAEGRRARQAETVTTFIQSAEEYSKERVYIPQRETRQSIEQKYAAISKQLDDREKRQGMTDEEVLNRAAAAKKDYEQARQNLDSFLLVNQGLKKTLTLRLEKWRMFQRYISARSRANFIYLLSERGFRGKLLIDHANKKIAIKVEPDETRKSASGRETKTLSGGEKSFSSICLLLSIWEAMGSPLRCLDEYDVFMDNVNRAVSTTMLVSLVKSLCLWLQNR